MARSVQYVNGVGRGLRRRYDLLPMSVVVDGQGDNHNVVANILAETRTIAERVMYVLDADVTLTEIVGERTTTWQVVIHRTVIDAMRPADVRSAEYVFRHVHGIPLHLNPALRVLCNDLHHHHHRRSDDDDDWLLHLVD